MAEQKYKSLESWNSDTGCSIRGAKDAPRYKDYILSANVKTDKSPWGILKQLAIGE